MEITHETTSGPITPAGEPDTTVRFGMYAELGALPSGAPVTKDELAVLFDRASISIDRAVERGELPRPAKLLGKDTWTAGSIIRHIEKRMQQAIEEYDAVAKHALRA